MQHGNEDWVKVGGDVDRLRISLRFSGDDLEPETVTSALGVPPSFAARKGTLTVQGGKRHIQPTGIWYLELAESDEWLLSDAIDELLSRIPAPPHTWEELAIRYNAEVFCGLFLQTPNRGATIEANVIKRLADRALSLDLDIYGVRTS